MDTKEWKELLKDKSDDVLWERLYNAESTGGQIDFLQSIYETGGANNRYSKRLEDAAWFECHELCQMTSAIHSLLREREEAIKAYLDTTGA